MSRGEWKSAAMVVRYEHASEERALLTQALNPYTLADNMIPFSTTRNSIAHVVLTTTPRWKVRYWTYRR